MSDIEAALREVARASALVDYEEEGLRQLVDEHFRVGSTGLLEKVREYRGGRAEDLVGELRIAARLAGRFKTPPVFEVGDGPDFRFDVAGAIVLVDAVHKSVSDALSTVLYPHPDRLGTYADLPTDHEWKKSAVALDRVLADLPVAVQPWVHSDLTRHRPDYQGRSEQERDCGDVVAWLASNLVAAVNSGTTSLEHPRGLARFDLQRIDTAPGHVNGHGPLNAAFVDEGWMRHDVKRKARKASERLARGGHCYLVGLDVDVAITSTGHDLQDTLLGPGISESVNPPHQNRTYRPVPVAAVAAYEQARQRGRNWLLTLAHFDPTRHDSYRHPEGLFFDPACASVTGVVALYYTEKLQFVPNPFSSTPIEAVTSRFPARLDPVAAD